MDLHAHDLTGAFAVGKLQFGYTRYITGGGLQAGVGVFLTIRPAAHAM